MFQKRSRAFTLQPVAPAPRGWPCLTGVVALSAAVACSIAACSGGKAAPGNGDDQSDGEDGGGGGSTGAKSDLPSPATPGLLRLTQRQHANALRDLLGPDVVLPALSAEQSAGGLAAVAAGTTTASEQDVERYELMTTNAVAHVFDDADRRGKLVTCAAQGAVNEACTKTFIASFGRRAFRRALTEAEAKRYEAVARKTSDLAGDPWVGLKSAVGAMLQSPKFLYRFELGQPDGKGKSVLSAQERASRLAFSLVGSIPDDELLAAAEDGRLLSSSEMKKQAQRLLEDQRARPMWRAFVEENYRLNDLERSAAQISADLMAAMKDEVLDAAESIAFSEDESFLEFFTKVPSPASPALRTHYGLAASGTFPDEQERVGFLSTAAFLTLTSTALHTSPTARGKFVRERVLCQEVPAAMEGVDTSLPPASQTARTTRERLDAHRSEPACKSCHAFMDPPGYAFERFDQLGKYRTTENGAPVRTDGKLDEEDDATAFSGPRQLVELLVKQPEVPYCLARGLLKQTTGYLETRMDAAEDGVLMEALVEQLAKKNLNIRSFLVELAGSDAFVTRHSEEMP